MASKTLKELKINRPKRRKIRAKPDYVIKITEYPKSKDKISPGRLVIAADVIFKR